MARLPLTARVRRILNDQRENQGAAQKVAMMRKRKENEDDIHCVSTAHQRTT
jgi:hypothetical protein